MHHKFKRHDKVVLKIAPLEDDIEYYADPPIPIKAGMSGKINVLLPNGQYHVEVIDDNGETIAYVALDEEALDTA